MSKLITVSTHIAITDNVRAEVVAEEFQRCHQNNNIDSFILFKRS